MSSIETATWLIAVLYVAAFLLLSRQAAREAGRSIWLFGKGAFDQRIPALLFRLAFVGAVAWAPIVVALGISGFSSLDAAAYDIAGNVLAAAGASIAIASQVYMGRSWRIGAAEGELGDIVDTGPFSLSRNPVFVGQFALFLGLFLSRPEFGTLSMLAAVSLAIAWQVRIEEDVLRSSLGEVYVRYQTRVRRWV